MKHINTKPPIKTILLCGNEVQSITLKVYNHILKEKKGQN